MSPRRAGSPSRYDPTRSGSPRAARRRWSASRSGTGTAGLAIVGLVQADLAGHALDGAGEPLAERLGRPALARRDLGPLGPVLPEVQEPPLVGREPGAGRVEQLLLGAVAA